MELMFPLSSARWRESLAGTFCRTLTFFPRSERKEKARGGLWELSTAEEETKVEPQRETGRKRDILRENNVQTLI